MDAEKGSTRKYELKKRAEEMAVTRRRITAAAVHLHGTVGPARTTVSGIAEAAGVQRHTVYRHFADDTELFGACSAMYFDDNPMPDPEPWRAIDDPHERLVRALDDLYAYYEQNQTMFSNVWRDIELVDALKPTMIPLQQYFGLATEILSRGRNARGRRRRLLSAALGHVLDFPTWRSLSGNDQLTRAEAIHLACALVESA